MGQMKTTNDKLFKLTLVTQVDPSRPAHEQTETIQAHDLRAAFKIAAKLFPDESRLGEIRVKEMPEMPEMVSIDKAFGDFAKACDKAVGKCQDFIDMDVTGKADARKPNTTAFDPRDSDAVADLKLAAAHPELFN